MLAVVGGRLCWKTLVAIIVMLSILGQCEMSIYPGLRRRPLQQAQSSSYEVNSDFLTQLMEENARRRLQQQFEQHLELINMKLMRQRQREERLKERYRQQQLAAMAAENDDDFDYIRKFKDSSSSSGKNNINMYNAIFNPQQNSVLNNENNNNEYGGSISNSNSGINNNNNNENFINNNIDSNANNNNLNTNNNNNVQYEQYDNTNQDFSYKYPTIPNIQTMRDRINFAVNPNDPRYYETEELDENAGGYMVGNMEASSALQQLRDEDAGDDNDVVADNDDGVEVDKEEDLDSQVLDDYEEYTPQEASSSIEAKAMGNNNNNNENPSTMILPPPQQSSGVVTNFHRIKPQSASAAAAAGVNTGSIKQVAPARQDMATLIDKLQPKGDHLPSSMENTNDAHMVMREHLGIKGEMGMYVVALIAGVSAAATVGLFVLGIAWYTFHNRSKAAADVDYPAYGVTGPNKDISPSGDRKLAQSAQMYHYQHQKQQIIAMENRQNNEENCEMSYVESDDDNEEGDYTVYECPGLAPTGEMEVKNPLFLDDTPVTPSLGNHPITQVSAQQPSVKKIFEKSQQQHHHQQQQQQQQQQQPQQTQQQQSSTSGALASSTSASATSATAAGNNVAGSSDDIKKPKKSKK